MNPTSCAFFGLLAALLAVAFAPLALRELVLAWRLKASAGRVAFFVLVAIACALAAKASGR